MAISIYRIRYHGVVVGLDIDSVINIVGSNGLRYGIGVGVRYDDDESI